MNKKNFLTFCFLLCAGIALAQLNPPIGNGFMPQLNSGEFNYNSPKEYIIGGITVSGTVYLDKDIIVQLSKLSKGNKIFIPSDVTANTLKQLWAQGIFDDIQLQISKILGDTVFINIAIKELPRLTRIDLEGLNKNETKELQEKLKDRAGKIVNANLTNGISSIIKKHFNAKGFLFTEVHIKKAQDTSIENHEILHVFVDKKHKVKVSSISFEGNKVFSDNKLRGFMSKTKQKAFYRVFGSGKFSQAKYEEDKTRIITKMQEQGYRDAAIISDTIVPSGLKTVKIHLNLHEGPKYYIGNISWVGNSKYSSEELNKILSMKKGDLFNQVKLDSKLKPGPTSEDIASLYMDDGYFDFRIEPTQTRVYQDTIDLEIRINEGPQYTINKVSIQGNNVTNDNVILRQVRTKPGDKFSKAEVIRTERDIAQSGSFDEQKTGVKPTTNPADGTVDLEYTVVEKPSDQVELSGGYGNGSFVGTLGLTFNNFSARNFFNLQEWKPLPKGDGQRLSIRGQTNGKSYHSYNLSFFDPWLGNKSPLGFGFNAFTSSTTAGPGSHLKTNGITFSLSQRLKIPDNYFSLENYPGFLFNTGNSYDFNITEALSRNSLAISPVYPVSGSFLRLTIKATPPYSLFNHTNYAIAPDQEKYRFTEYYKCKFEAQWFQRIYGNLILKTQAQFGFLGMYNRAVGQSPFERFKLGGNGMQGFDFLQGSEVIPMRGYVDNSVIPVGSNPFIAQNSGSPIFSKYVLELRYPVTMNPQASVYVLAFAEGGNTWNDFHHFSPFNIRRSLGLGARLFLPIFGLLGIDYGYGFDAIPGSPGANGFQFQFSIAQQLVGFQ